MNISKLALTVSMAAALLVSSVASNAFYDHHEVPENIKAAVANSERSDDDRKSDAGRKPAEMLTFIGVKPGMTAMDINSGGGYYTEILSYAVGSEGKVIAHNGAVYWDYVHESVGKRYDGRLENVTQIHNGHEEVDVEAGSVDVAMMMMAYHDYFYNHKARTNKEDMTSVLGSIYAAMKKGGVLVIEDHVALAGSGEEAGDKVHRIDPALVTEQVEAAGFKLVGSSDLLANPDDTHSLGVFDPAIQGKTDRFILKFVK